MGTQSLEFKSGLDDSKFQDGLKNMEKGAKASAGKISGMTKGFGITDAVSAAISGGKAALNMGGELDDQADQLNMNVETMQKLQGVMLKSGVAEDKFVMGMKEIGEAMVAARNEGGAALEKFTKLGISFETIDDVGDDTSKMFYIMADAIKNHESTLDATTAATGILGGKQGKMAAAMKAGSEEIKKQEQSIKFLTAEEVEYTARMGDAAEEKTNNLKKEAASVAIQLANKGKVLGGMKGKVEPPYLGPGAKRRENPDDVKAREEAENKARKAAREALKIRKEALVVVMETAEEEHKASQDNLSAARETLKNRLSGKREPKETTKEKRVNRMMAELEKPTPQNRGLSTGKLSESYRAKPALQAGGINSKTRSLSTKRGVREALSEFDKAKEKEKDNARNLKIVVDLIKNIEKGINGE